MRALRLQQLEKLNDEGDVPRIPDGVAILTSPTLMIEHGRRCDTNSILSCAGSNQEVKETIAKLWNPLSCYICHKPYIELHFFYHQLCPDCAAFNFKKRDEMTDMHGKVCIVTGARCKIGFRCALKLLRCGASVIATTRFPRDAAARYVAESDSSMWIKKLHIYGIDFRDISRLESFCKFVTQHYDRLDVIVNNACQTVRRPSAYYAHLIDAEIQYNSISGNLSGDSTNPMHEVLQKNNLFCHEKLKQTNQLIAVADNVSEHCIASRESNNWAINNLSSAEMTQLIIAPEDIGVDETAFPAGALDVNNQQVDLRKKNSWTMKLHEVSTPELAEVFAINTMAPAILNAKLKPLMERNISDMKFIVNVSAMEGKFYRFKSENHPHTNMAKAALNMMTRTSAQDYVKSKIYMTAVDTGWINDEKPIELAVAHEKKHKFQTPLDEIDAAARVLDPIISPLKLIAEGERVEPPWGIFLKDYMKCEW